MKKKKRAFENKRVEGLSRLYLQRYPAKSHFAEAYRSLRTNISFSFMAKEFRSLLVTSAGEKEGKTLTAANLAYTMCQADDTVLLIDADLRQPMLHRLLSCAASPGLTDLLSDLFSTDIRSGSLEQFGVSDLYRLLSFQKKTGLLRLSDRKEEIELFFLQGELVDLNWLTRPADKKLCHVLIKNGLLTTEQADLAVRRQEDACQKLGFMLINMGLVNKESLTGPLTIQMIEGLRTALQMKTGGFSFKAFPESDFEGASFDPVDFRQVYHQVIIGQEEFPYLRKKIDSAILATQTTNLFLLPAGSLPPNPSDLLGSERMSFLISYLKKKFDVLVIDSSPILPASDALLLAPQTDGVVLMVKSGLMNREMVKRGVEQLQLAQAHLLGVVLNQVDMKKDTYYKYYHKYYPSYYGGRQ